jgi:ADP-heptose:LPS heptosyltransferase
MPRLQIHDSGERRLVGAADRALGLGAALLRRHRRQPLAPSRILLLRLERIGDLLMALPAIADVRARAPQAHIDLVVGSWNDSLARAIPAVSRVETLDADWLARGEAGLGLAALLRRARGWRGRRYDLVLNFEPDIRSNLLAAAAGGTWTAGYRSGGGGPLLDQALDYEPGRHTTDNARRLVAAVLGAATPVPAAALVPPADAVAAAERILGAARRRPLVGLHASGGRAIKQWEPSRFAAVARALADDGATVVLTGAAGDRPIVDEVARAIDPRHLVDAAGDVDLVVLAALLQRLDLFVTGDTGPMHLAHAVGTPIVAVFGPSDPARYAPRGPLDRVVRIDLPCAPCNRIRRPPARCVGHTPDCLSGIAAGQVLSAARAVLAETGRRAAAGAAQV